VRHDKKNRRPETFARDNVSDVKPRSAPSKGIEKTNSKKDQRITAGTLVDALDT
jgi:hypothetical protein